MHDVYVQSQGMTIPLLEVSFNNIFEYGQGYVALSRATCLQGLTLRSFSPHSIKAHTKVVDFYRHMEMRQGVPPSDGSGSLGNVTSTVTTTLEALAAAFDSDLPEAPPPPDDGWIDSKKALRAELDAAARNYQLSNLRKMQEANGSGSTPSAVVEGFESSVGPFSSPVGQQQQQHDDGKHDKSGANYNPFDDHKHDEWLEGEVTYVQPPARSSTSVRPASNVSSTNNSGSSEHVVTASTAGKAGFISAATMAGSSSGSGGVQQKPAAAAVSKAPVTLGSFLAPKPGSSAANPFSLIGSSVSSSGSGSASKASGNQWGSNSGGSSYSSSAVKAVKPSYGGVDQSRPFTATFNPYAKVEALNYMKQAQSADSSSNQNHISNSSAQRSTVTNSSSSSSGHRHSTGGINITSGSTTVPAPPLQPMAEVKMNDLSDDLKRYSVLSCLLFVFSLG